MIDLFADRFVVERGGTTPGKPWLDLATGSEVLVRIANAGDRRDQLAWSDRCAEIARLRHPMFNVLADFGTIGSSRTFEAYAVDTAVRTTSAVSMRLLAHARAFLESRRVQLHREMAAHLIRESPLLRCRTVRRAIGVVLQPRTALAFFEEVLQETAPGIVSVNVVGRRGCGLRTLGVLIARSARLAGYVPVASNVLARLPWLLERIERTHVCLLLDEAASVREREEVAKAIARLGAASARRHVVVTFARARGQATGAIEVDPMSVNALTGMVFLEQAAARREELWTAAGDAAGMPGVFLERLGVARSPAAPARVALVRESSPAYVVPTRASAVTPKRSLGRILRDAPERGVKLARRGRHAAAIRLLSRAARVLEARGELSLSAACVEQLGWIERARGRSDRALEAFHRTRTVGSDGAFGVSGALGTGIIWTDERRLNEAEAVLRGAHAAAALLGHGSLEQRALRGLARCLYWQRKYGDAASILCEEDESVEAFALKSRLALATDEVRSASMLAMRAWNLASGSDDLRLVAVAARSMALVNAAIGNREQVLRWVAEGTRASTAAHLPIVGLRLRAIAGGPWVQSALRHRQLPTLVRDELESAFRTGRRHSAAEDDAGQERGLRELHELLTTIHGAVDDSAGLEAVCRLLAERTRAATAQIVAGARVPRMLARCGRPWQGDISDVDRILAGGAAVSMVSNPDLRHAFEPITYGQDVIAVLCCRWPAGSHIDRAGTSSRIKAAALAAAASVRALLDRSNAPQAEAAIGELIGTSPPAVALRESIARAARSPFPILVEGESGSGKELVARGIHRLGARRDRRLCTINCAALTDDLLEAELFGHSRGAFTGAIGERAGLFEEADGGTLFLDEVGELSPRAQAKLLRVLQDGEVRRVGENLPRRVDTRVIAATNRRLDEEVAAQRFRADLRFRLDVVRIVVPPLRERATDIPALALHFWSEAAARVGSSASLAPETLAALSRYDWPGNVRELQNAIAALAVHAPRRGRVAPVLLPSHIAGAITPGGTSFDAARQEFERRYVRAALAQAAGHRSRAARTLGVSRQGLAKMLRRLGIDG